MSRTLQPDPSWFEIDPAFYARGGTCFNPAELELLDDIAGHRVLVGPVTPENRGEEALSLVNLGARVTAFAWSDADLAPARDLAGAAGLPVDWATAPPGSVPADGEPFGAAISTFGALDAIPALDAWAESLAQALLPGGRLLISDRHPIARVAEVYKGLLVVGHSYFGDARGEEPWTLGDLLTSLAAAGFALLSFEEFPGSDRYHTRLDELPGLRWEHRWRLPGAFLALFSLAAPPDSQ